MIEISRATKKDSLVKEWHLLDIPHYGKHVMFIEKKFRFKVIEDGKLIFQ